MSMTYGDFSPVRVAVVGGGAAGMMAAISAANMGADVTLFERNDRLGKKLRITGKGRCNVTNDCDRDAFLANVPTKIHIECPSDFTNKVTVNPIRVVRVISGKRRNSNRYLTIAITLERNNAKK